MVGYRDPDDDKSVSNCQSAFRAKSVDLVGNFSVVLGLTELTFCRKVGKGSGYSLVRTVNFCEPCYGVKFMVNKPRPVKSKAKLGYPC